jgi:TonB-linked SusC/RagA family outer membrane protein
MYQLGHIRRMRALTIGLAASVFAGGAFASAACASGALAQTAPHGAVQLADGMRGQAVRFYYVPAPGAPEVDAEHIAVLTRRISLSLASLPLSQALEVIARKAGLRVTYETKPGTPLDTRVTFAADNVTVEAALTDVLADVGLDVRLSPDGVMAIIPHRAQQAPLRPMQGAGRIIGRVVDSVSNAGIDQVGVRIDVLGIGSMTTADGRYVITNVPVGTYRVTARRVGFTARTLTITIRGDSTEHLDFHLLPTTNRLDEVVTTAVGDQRRYTIGNEIATIKVDSLIPTTPVTSLTDVISARAPGVEVLESNGEVGNGPSLRIRGQGSLVLQGDPIVIIDGVRVDNTPGGTVAPLFGYGTGGGAVPAPSRLNDIDFNDIETIDILKGPSAATEYGTDAANGVIVIKTKHSRPGPPNWNLSAEQSFSQVGTTFPNTYYSYGHTTGASPQPIQCPMIPNADNVGVGWTNGTCAVDSVVEYQALNNPDASIFGTGHREKVDLSVGGGSEGVRYYVGGGLTNETGPLQMPKDFIGLADSIGLPKSLFHPNWDNQRSARANVYVQLKPKLDMQASAAYMTTDQQAPESPSLYETTYTSAPINNRANLFGWGPELYDTPIYEYGNIVGQGTNRFTGSLAFNWNPVSWLSGHVTVGVDHGSQNASAEIVPQIANLYPDNEEPAALSITNGTTDIYSFDSRLTATFQVTPAVKSTTSGGLQLADTRTQSTYVQSNTISATNPTLDGAVDPITYQYGQRQATLGGYVEEQVGLWERLFLTGAIRVDAGSGFGSNYNSAIYPKASFSYLALNGGATSVRLRGAFGESGVQPPNGAAMQLYSPAAAYINGSTVPTAGITNVVNAGLEPERTNEFEGGIDVGFLHDRLNVSLTGYAKSTSNALVQTGTGWELGGYNSYENVGQVTNNGVEATVSATLLKTNQTSWDVTINASTNHNDLVKLAPGLQPQELYGDHAVFRFAPGTPLYGYAAEKEHWTDLNHDGIVEPNEVTVDDTLSYAGTSQPTRMASLGTHLGILHGLVTFGALFDYRGGFRLLNTTAFHSATYIQSDQASNDPKAPTWEQLRDVATNIAYTKGIDDYAPSAGFYEDASYVRFRELSATLALPDRWAHVIRFRNLSLTGAIRNLALWTPYTGGDPEVTSSEGGGTMVQPTSNTLFVNHDIREGAQAVPLSRYFVLRLNAGF